jgi:hypothetical protein
MRGLIPESGDCIHFRFPSSLHPKQEYCCELFLAKLRKKHPEQKSSFLDACLPERTIRTFTTKFDNWGKEEPWSRIQSNPAATVTPTYPCTAP